MRISHIKKSFWLKGATTAIAIVSSSTLVAAGVETTLDYDRINATIASAIDPAVAGSEVIESALVTIDGKVTDFDKDTYKVDKSMVLKKSPWSASPLTMNLSFTAGMKRNENPEKGKLETNLDVSLKTDTLALLKFIQLKKVKRCDERTETGVKAIFQRHECDLARGIMKAGSLAEVGGMIKAHVEAERTELKSFEAESLPAIESAQSVLLREEGVKLIDKARRKLRYLDSVKVEEHASGGFTVSAEHGRSNRPGCKIKHVEMVLDPESAVVKVEASTRLKTAMYDAIKPEMAHMFKGLEEGREFAVEHIAAHARVGERLISSMVKHGAEAIQQAGQEDQGEAGQQGGDSQMPLQLMDLVDAMQQQQQVVQF